MFVESRDESREFFRQVWSKMASGASLEPLESLIAAVITQHPEYHSALGAGSDARPAADDPAANPFLHMGLHIAVAEQLQSDRPAGVRALYQQLLSRYPGNVHALEHRIMACLGDALWQAGQNGAAPDEQQYLRCLQQLVS